MELRVCWIGVKPESDIGLVLEAIGLTVDGPRRLVENKVSRRWKIHFGLLALLRFRCCTQNVMQVVTGLLTHALAIERPALSIPEACYSFAGEDNRIVLRLPDEVFAEFWCAAFSDDAL